MTGQKEAIATTPARYILPHMRGLSRPVGSEPKSQPSGQAIDAKPRGKLPPLSQQMQKRLVIMDDEEYGM